MKTDFKKFLREKCNYQEKDINLIYRRMYKKGIKISDINYVNYDPRLELFYVFLNNGIREIIRGKEWKQKCSINLLS